MGLIFEYAMDMVLYVVMVLFFDVLLNKKDNSNIQSCLPDIGKCTCRCFLCRGYFTPRTFVKNTLYNKKFQCLLLRNVNCKTTNIIYLLECKIRCLQYPGEVLTTCI